MDLKKFEDIISAYDQDIEELDRFLLARIQDSKQRPENISHVVILAKEELRRRLSVKLEESVRALLDESRLPKSQQVKPVAT